MPLDLVRDELEAGSGRPGELGLVLRVNPATGKREMGQLEWGLLPHDTQDPRTAPRPTHARAETVMTKPMFADAFRRRRCIVPADAFFQRDTVGRNGGRNFSFSRRDGQPLSLAGLWEGYRWPDGRVTRSYCVVTVESNADMAPIHHRMPLVLEKDDWAVWLGEKEGDVEALLRPLPTCVLTKRPGKAR